MSTLNTLLDALNLRYFSAPNEYLLIFRGEIIDHHVLLRTGDAFLHATCIVGRVPSPLGPEFAGQLLEWNARHSVVRIALSQGELLLLADLSLQSLQPSRVEELVLSVAAAAEELAAELLPLILTTCRTKKNNPAREPAAPSPAAVEIDYPDPGLQTSPEPSDGEIDWNEADL